MIVLADIFSVALRAGPDYVAAVCVLGIILLLPLYLSQRRDVQRLRAFMEAAPDHPAADLIASEALLDRAEAELEELAPAPQPTPARPVTPPTPVPATAPVTSERPALERITMERAALEPHPRWRRFAARVGQPRVLIVTAVGAAVLGVGAILGTSQLLDSEEGGRPQQPGAVVPGNVEVAVLNGTSVPGLAAKVADDVEANEFRLGDVTNSANPYDQTVVMFARGQQPAAEKVARALGVKPVQPIDKQTERLAGGADVVVIAGADRTRL